MPEPVKKKNIMIPEVGEVLLEESRRARRMNLSVRPIQGVRVAVPKGVSFKSAEAFARSKADWIVSHLLKLKIIEAEVSRKGKQLSPIVVNRKKARESLVQRLDELSQKFGLPYNRVFVRNQKTRWGSCSAKKNINLNVNLVRLPPELMDYAIVHELAHTKELNHSPAFWNFLERLVTDSKKLDRELGKYSLYLVNFI